MSDFNNYNDDYELQNEELEEEYDEEFEEEAEKNPEKLMKIIIGAVVVAVVVVVVLVCILFGAKSGKDEETTAPESSTEEITTEAAEKYTAGSYTVTVPGNGQLNLRADTTMESEALIAVPHGTLLNVTEVKLVVSNQNEEQFWGKTSYLGWNGWVSMEYLTKAYSETIVTPAEQTTAAPVEESTSAATEEKTTVATEPTTNAAPTTNTGKPQTTGTYTIDVDADPGKVNMRDNHSVSATMITSIPAGTQVTVVEVYHDATAAKELAYWGKVTYAGYTGWIAMWYLK